MPGSAHRFPINVAWVIKLRWVAVGGQLITIAVSVWGLGIALTLWPLLVVIGLTTVSNAILMTWSARLLRGEDPLSAPSWNVILALVMTLDMLSLTTLLYATGGPTNPFCLFFFVNLSLSAVVLERGGAWLLNLLSMLCFAGLLYAYIPLPQLDLGPDLLPASLRGGISLEQVGLLVAFSTCASVIVYFMTRLTGELREREAATRLNQQVQARSDKLEALGTLAAGAAHELSTPLTTIAVVAKDVEQALQERAPAGGLDGDVVEDVMLIRAELDRCKRILDRMAGHSGQTVGEMVQRVSEEELWQAVAEGLTHPEAIEYWAQPSTRGAPLDIPLDALSQALRGLVQNALDASQPGQPVQVRVTRHGNTLHWTVSDSGHGMPPEVLARVSEPFFTTKQPGKGMGLGVFLAKNVLERLGGELHLESQPHAGTTVTAHLPLAESTTG